MLWVSESVSQRMGKWVSEPSMGQWVKEFQWVERVSVEWVSGWMNQWVSRCASESVILIVSELVVQWRRSSVKNWMSQLVSQWANEWVSHLLLWYFTRESINNSLTQSLWLSVCDTESMNPWGEWVSHWVSKGPLTQELADSVTL